MGTARSPFSVFTWKELPWHLGAETRNGAPCEGFQERSLVDILTVQNFFRFSIIDFIGEIRVSLDLSLLLKSSPLKKSLYLLTFLVVIIGMS